MNPTLLIFDMNGTVVDTEQAHWLAYQEILKKYDITFTLEEFSSEWTAQGKDLKDTLIINNREDLLPRLKEIKAEKDVVFRAHIADRVTIMPGMHNLLKNVLKGRVHLALDSTSAMEDIQQILDHVDLSDVFELITSGKMEWDEEKYRKSSKGSRFRYISDTLRIPPTSCVVVGDAEKDVKAALSESMYIVSIPNEYTVNIDFSGADKVLKSADDVTLKLIQEIIKNHS